MVDVVLDVIGVKLPPFGQTGYERAIAAARVGLDEAAFTAAHAIGRSTPLIGVVAEIEHELIRPEQADGDSGKNGPFGLTAREHEVLRLLPGRTSREVAALLSLSPRTIEHHVDSILGKLGARNRSEAVAVAARYGLL
jgi:DNA-binding CsgD family transcriptional regulator